MDPAHLLRNIIYHRAVLRTGRSKDMINKCRGCGKQIVNKDGTLCTVEHSKTHPNRIDVIKTAFKHNVATWDAKGKQTDTYYLCWDCEVHMIEAVKEANR